jgi:hypothetical protein
MEIAASISAKGEVRTLDAERPERTALLGGRISAVRQLNQHVRVAPFGGAPAHEVLAAQVVQRGHERGLSHDPRTIFRYDLVARAVAADHEWIA